jgi:hypothetical protein
MFVPLWSVFGFESALRYVLNFAARMQLQELFETVLYRLDIDGILYANGSL